MDTEHGGQPQGPEFSDNSPENDPTFHSHAYADFEATLLEPELGPKSDDIRGVLGAFAKFGRVALESGDSDEYKKWADHAGGLLDGLQLDQESIYVPGQFYSDLAGVYFQGVMGGNAEAMDRLSELLGSDEDGARLEWVVRLCAESKVPPDGWINRFAKNLGEDDVNPDRRANAWGAYVLRAKYIPELRGEQPLVNEEAFAGSRVVLDDLVGDNLSSDTAMAIAPRLFELEVTGEGKAPIVAAYRRAARVVAAGVDFGSQEVPHYIESMSTFGADVICDSDLPDELKREFAKDVSAHSKQWDSGAQKPEALLGFEITLQAFEKVSSSDVVRSINQMALSRDNDYVRTQLTDGLFRRSAEAYASLGNTEDAADMVARIDGISTWTEALVNFAKHSGNPDRALHLDMRSVMPEDPDWEMRKKRAAIIGAMTSGLRPGGDATEGNQRAGSLLLQLAQEDALREEKDFVTPRYIGETVRQLAANDARVGGDTAKKIVEAWRRSDNHEPAYQEQLLHVMLDNRTPGAVKEYWEFIEHHPVSRAVDFERYATALLAETME